MTPNLSATPVIDLRARPSWRTFTTVLFNRIRAVAAL